MRAVRGSKKRFLRSQQQTLENLLGNPKRRWRAAKKLGIACRNRSVGGLGKVCDNNTVGELGSGE